ncbi:MAG: transcription antitermination factor NusB [Mariprofundaceae bacterium]|nr:transcription antitermination factor NusB [Mariprofundaceae bacterium]
MNKPLKGKGPNRHQARESAVEVLYAWQSGECDDRAILGLIAGRLEEEDREQQDQEYLQALVYGVRDNREALDEEISSAINRSLRSVATLELNILRLAVWELINRLEIPYRVIINEALELARDYTDEPARSFINGVLDKLAKRLRAKECK